MTKHRSLVLVVRTQPTLRSISKKVLQTVVQTCPVLADRTTFLSLMPRLSQIMEQRECVGNMLFSRRGGLVLGGKS